MILLLRGHIRNAFDDLHLKDVILYLKELYLDLKIYIHTWNKISNSISWRPVVPNESEVTLEMINTYFGELKGMIHHISIDDDKRIELNGVLSGNVCKSNMPILGWKNYWYGQYKLITYVKQHIPSNEPVINCRFDVLNNSNSFHLTYIQNFLAQNRRITQNVFIHKNTGLDNFYLGTIDSMNTLISYFHFHLDTICLQYPYIQNQEFLVYLINESSHIDKNPMKLVKQKTKYMVYTSV